MTMIYYKPKTNFRIYRSRYQQKTDAKIKLGNLKMFRDYNTKVMGVKYRKTTVY